MESKGRKANRTPEQIRNEYEGKRAYHVAQVEAWAVKIAKLDEPRKPRQRKASMNGVFKAAKDSFSTDELMEILETAKRKKREMEAE